MLVAASREVGGAQIQNRGTLGGNVANASPAGDTLAGACRGECARSFSCAATRDRTVPIRHVLHRLSATSVRRPDELIAAIEIPRIDGEQWWRKVGTRRAQAISKIMMAAVRGSLVRVAVGSVGPTVVRLPHTEDALSSLTPVEDARRILEREISPIDDLRSTADYRRRVCGNLLVRFWHETA